MMNGDNRGGLTCAELVELVTDYLEGTLDPLLRQRMEVHLASCRGCATYLEQMRLTIQTLGQLTEENIDPKASVRLLAVFRSWKAG